MDDLKPLLNLKIVLDLRSPYVCLGKLKSLEKDFLVLQNADFHDLRDSPTTRENYTVAAKESGIKKNRKQVWIKYEEIVAISRFEDILDSDVETV